MNVSGYKEEKDKPKWARGSIKETLLVKYDRIVHPASEVIISARKGHESHDCFRRHPLSVDLEKKCLRMNANVLSAVNFEGRSAMS